MEFLLDNIEFGESKISNYLSEVLAGKDWLEQHSAEQERWIGELQSGKDWLEQHSKNQEKIIQEQRRAWEERGEALKRVQETNKQLKQRCDQQEAIILEQAKELSCNPVVRLLKQLYRRMTHIFKRLAGKEP